MKYRWTSCPQCHCEVTVNYTDTPDGILGSVRRWNRDRTINDGKALKLAASDRPAGQGFSVECVCGGRLDVPARPDAVSAEREGDLRVDLRDL